MKIIVTHICVDLDAATACWLITKFFPGWEKAQFKFVFAGDTLDGKNPDEDKSIIHVDTGLGKYDHHQFADNNLSATKIVFEKVKIHVTKTHQIDALERMVNYVTLIDNFKEVYFNAAAADIHDFGLNRVVEGIRHVLRTDEERLKAIFIVLDGIYQNFLNKIRAEAEIRQGLIIKTKWGKGLALETKNEEVVKLALKMGYKIVIRKDPDKGHVRIKAFPEKQIDLRNLFEKIIEIDKKGTWFFHSSGKLLLNGSSKNPKATPTKLSIPKIIEIINEL